MSQGYRLNGGVIGFKHLWESDKTGVWDIKSPFVNNNIPPVPFGEYLYTSIGTHTFTVPTDVTLISVLVIGGGGGGMYYNTQQSGGSGGSGGGGAGKNGGSNNGGGGSANTGGGGGGGSLNPAGSGGSGGSGIVIIRYPSDYTITVGSGLTSSTSTVGSDKVTTFTAGTDNISFST